MDIVDSIGPRTIQFEMSMGSGELNWSTKWCAQALKGSKVAICVIKMQIKAFFFLTTLNEDSLHYDIGSRPLIAFPLFYHHHHFEISWVQWSWSDTVGRVVSH